MTTSPAWRQIQYQHRRRKAAHLQRAFRHRPASVGPHRLSYFAVDRGRQPRGSSTTGPSPSQSAVSAASFEVRGKSVERGGTVFLAPGSVVLLKSAEGRALFTRLTAAAQQTYSTPISGAESGSHRLSFHAVDELGIAGATIRVNLAADRAAPNSSLHFEGPQLTRGIGHADQRRNAHRPWSQRRSGGRGHTRVQPGRRTLAALYGPFTNQVLGRIRSCLPRPQSARGP